MPAMDECATCGDLMADMVEDGIERRVCPTCGPQARPQGAHADTEGLRAGWRDRPGHGRMFESVNRR